jgi:putative ABC transport system permease protein
MLNEAAVRSLGFNSPEDAIDQVVFEVSTFVGQTRHFPRRIIGVAENSAYFQLKRPAETPQLYRLNTVTSPVTRILIRHDGRNEAATRQAIQATWRESTGSSPLYYSYVDDVVEDSYAAETTTSRLLLVAAFFTVVLSCLGMYALVSTTLNAQSKSIAIRSVFGAVVSHIMALYCVRFSKPVLVAMLLGCPAAIWIVLRWIQQFPYQLDKTWIALIACGAAVFILLLAWSVVCVLTARVMHRKPSRVLRYE